MTPDIIKAIVPFGLAGLAIVSIVIVAINPEQRNNWLLGGIIFLIFMVFTIEKFLPGLITAPESEKKPGAGEAFWFFTGTKGDWGGRDLAYTKGNTPAYRSALGKSLCDANSIGNVVTCWENRSAAGGAQAPGVDSNVSPSETQWCAHKLSDITMAVAANGAAPQGKVYVCSQPVAKN